MVFLTRGSEYKIRNMIKTIFRNKLMVISVLILTAWTVAGIAGPFLSPYSYDEADQDARFQAPSSAHPMGTDIMGRDVLARILFGARISLLVGFSASFVSVLIGTLYGTISGYYGGWIDSLMMRIVDIIYGLPYIIFVIILMVLIGRGISNIFIALIAVMWLTMARIVRGQVLSIKEKEYIEAARALGVNSSRIIFRHNSEYNRSNTHIRSHNSPGSHTLRVFSELSRTRHTGPDVFMGFIDKRRR